MFKLLAPSILSLLLLPSCSTTEPKKESKESEISNVIDDEN